MTKSHPQDKTSRETVDCFCRQVFWLKQIHYICRELFEDDGSESLMQKTAPRFFADLNTILIDYFLLEIAKLTDPAKSGKRENFTVANLIESIDWPSACLKKIEKLNETVLTFRKYIEPARNKLLAHYDKTAVISKATLGAFPKDEDKKLLDVLEQMCNVVHEIAYGEIIGSMVVDKNVLDFKKTLGKAIVFDKLFNDAKGKDLSQLYSLLQNVLSGRA